MDQTDKKLGVDQRVKKLGLVITDDEMVFLRWIEHGLKIMQEELTDLDIEVLLSRVFDIEQTEQLFSRLPDAPAWEERLHKALAQAYASEVRQFDNPSPSEIEYRLVTKKMGVPLYHPREVWDFFYNRLYSGSEKTINGIVQNFMIRKWKDKPGRTGCLALFLLPIVLLTLSNFIL